MEFYVEEQEAEEETKTEMEGAGDGSARRGVGAQKGGERPQKRGMKPAGTKRGPYRKRSFGARERERESLRATGAEKIGK